MHNKLSTRMNNIFGMSAVLAPTKQNICCLKTCINAVSKKEWQHCLNMSAALYFNSEFSILIFSFLVFSCIKVGDNDPNVFLKCATTSKSVFLNGNGDAFENICDKTLALKYVQTQMKVKSCEGWSKRINLLRSFQCCFIVLTTLLFLSLLLNYK